jgi:hypothetical protein
MQVPPGGFATKVDAWIDEPGKAIDLSLNNTGFDCGNIGCYTVVAQMVLSLFE